MENLLDFIKQTKEQTSKEMRDVRITMDEITKEIKADAENELKKFFERW